MTRKSLVQFLILIAACIPLASCIRDRPPERDGYIVHAYHYCPKCGSLQGGIYEKGPFRKFPGPNKEQCVHEWQEITREHFMEMATTEYGKDWSKEPARFWNPPEAGDLQSE